MPRPSAGKISAVVNPLERHGQVDSTQIIEGVVRQAVALTDLKSALAGSPVPDAARPREVAVTSVRES